MRRRSLLGLSPLGLTTAGILLAACAGEPPSAPRPPAAVDLTEHAFRLTIDTRSGRIDIEPPQPPAAATRELTPSLSLMGSEAVRPSLPVILCSFTPLPPIPGKPRLKRCTFTLRLRNRLSAVDLVTPTTFPRPPASATGILVFPWVATAQGALVTAAIPSPDWDGGPVDFFNDFNGCSSGGKTDCYRYKTFASPLYAGQESESRTVGFDVPTDATVVTAYIVVAADLRDNPIRTTILQAEPGLCGYIDNDDGSVSTDGIMQVSELLHARGFCSFSNYFVDGNGITHFYFTPDDIIVRAKLRLRTLFHDDPSDLERVDFGTTLEAADYDIETLGTFNFGPDGELDTWWAANVIAHVQEGAAQLLPRFQYRLRSSTASGEAWYSLPSNQLQYPRLEVEYRKR